MESEIKICHKEIEFFKSVSKKSKKSRSSKPSFLGLLILICQAQPSSKPFLDFWPSPAGLSCKTNLPYLDFWPWSARLSSPANLPYLYFQSCFTLLSSPEDLPYLDFWLVELDQCMFSNFNSTSLEVTITWLPNRINNASNFMMGFQQQNCFSFLWIMVFRAAVRAV